ncbi:MAG: transporter substrate-binding domain-containing protein [Bacteroidales bacterium]|nr:transporter substrate-binding domain-containing protein [Bacteroidales bacterium]
MQRLFIIILFLFPLYQNIFPQVIPDDLDSDDILWVRQNAANLRFAPNPTWPPAEFIDDSGNYQGIVADYVGIIEKKLGVSFPQVRFNTWDEIIQALKNGDADWVPGIHKNEEREKFLTFTDVFLESPVVIFCRNDKIEKYYRREDGEFKLACTKGYAAVDFVSQKYPWMEIVECPDDLSALLMTSAGNVDGAVLDVMTASYLIQKYGITNLAYASETGFTWKIAMAVRKEYAPFAGILNKILRSISTEEREKIYQQWVTIDVTKSIDYKYQRVKKNLLIFVLVLSIIAIIAGLFAILLRIEVKRKTKDLTLANQQAAQLLEKLGQEIQEKCRIAKDLEQTTRKLEDIFRATHDGIIIVNKENFTIEDCNERAAKLLDIELCNEIQGKPISLIEAFQEGGWREIVHESGRGENRRMELNLKRKDGTSLWIELNSKEITIHQKDSFLLILRDISESKNYEIQLEKALEEARHSDRLKSAFLRNISHEFRTPMNSILGFTDLLKDKSIREEYLDVFLDRIQASGQRLINLIDEMVEISRLESGEMQLSKEPVNLYDFLENVKSDFTAFAGKKGLSIILKRDLASPSITCLTDPAALSTIFKHLLNNSIKYSNEGLIELGIDRKAEEIILYVKDIGIGIPRERMEAVFNPFEQSDLEDIDAREGIGLGLTIAKKYTHLLGGQIWIESAVGKGTIVFISLPCLNNA